jgi:hypothetical protein
MSEPTHGMIEQEFFALYSAGEYAEPIDIRCRGVQLNAPH